MKASIKRGNVKNKQLLRANIHQYVCAAFANWQRIVICEYLSQIIKSLANLYLAFDK